MSDRMASWQYGEPNPVLSKAVASADVIEVGDMVVDSGSGVIKAMSSVAWDTNIATTQEAGHDVFLGVAQERSRSGDTNPIRVNTTGVHEFDCAAATFEIGDLVGPAKQSGNGIESQKVVAVATANLAIGRVAKRYGSNTTKVLVAVESVKMTGGPRAMA